MRRASFDSKQCFRSNEWPTTPTGVLDALKGAGWPSRQVLLTHEASRELAGELSIPIAVPMPPIWDTVPGAPTPMWLTSLTSDSANAATWQRVALSLARGTPGRSALLVGVGERRVRVAVCASPQRGSFVWEGARLEARNVAMLATILAAQSPSVAAMRLSHELERREVDRRFFADVRRWRDAMAEGWSKGPEDNGPRQTLAMTTLARLLFLAFVQRKSWLAGNTNYLAQHLLPPDAEQLYQSRLLPLFFDALNRAPAERAERELFEGVPFLNGGLFERSVLERTYPALDLPDEVLREGFVRVIEGYRFVEDESSSASAAVDPRMLGAVFEGLMCDDRRSRTGAFYTPPTLVSRVVDASLDTQLYARLPQLDALRTAQRISPSSAREASSVLRSLRIIDPAAGSGAFLLGALDWLAPLRWWAWACDPATAHRTLADARRAVISDNLYGVDVSSTAVLLCELRLWLALASAMPDGITNEVMPLPNLHHRVRVGNTLHDHAHYAPGSASVAHDAILELRDCNAALSNSTGVAKRELDKQRSGLEREIAATRVDHALTQTVEKLAALERIDASPDLFGGTLGLSPAQRRERSRLEVARDALGDVLIETAQDHWRPSFDAAVHFADVFAAGGFDVVVGNPPWVRAAELPPQERRRLKERYQWMRGSGRAFGSQPDLSVAFVERSVELLRAGGTLGLVLPSKLLSAEYARAMRRGLAERTHVVEIEDLASSSNGLFSAETYPAVLVATRNTAAQTVPVQIIKKVRMFVDLSELWLGSDPGDPWRLLSREERTLLRALSRTVTTLRERWPVKMGVKTGANRVFLNPPDGVSPVVSVLRGRDIQDGEFRIRDSILFAHDGVTGLAFSSIDGPAYAHIMANLSTLEARSDVKGSTTPWSVFRVCPGALGDRVVWRDIGKTLDAVVVPSVSEGGPVVLNTTYYVPLPDEPTARLVRAWITHPLMRWLAETTAEPALSGYLRFQTTNVGALPVPAGVSDLNGVWASVAEGAELYEQTRVMCSLLGVSISLVDGVLGETGTGGDDGAGTDQPEPEQPERTGAKPGGESSDALTQHRARPQAILSDAQSSETL
jgi:hypothetical protein